MRLAPFGFLTVASFVLAACGTPQERCIRSATKELRTVEALIAETHANLSRGYRYERDEIIRYAWVRCDREYLSPGHLAPRQMCWEPYTDIVERPVAIDPAAEKRALDGLNARRTTLERQAAIQIDACKAESPEPN